MGIITLVGYIVARKNYTFQFRGGSQECINCRLRKVCIDKLKVGHVYRVVNVLGIRNKCPVNEYVITVEVEEVPVEACIPKKYAIESMIIHYLKIRCDQVSCRYFRFCRPDLLPDEAKTKVVKLVGEAKCPKGMALAITSLLVVESVSS